MLSYGASTKIFRLGNLKSARDKESQNIVTKAIEYITFVLFVIIHRVRDRPHVLYAYDRYGLIPVFIASHVGKKIPVIYHILDLPEQNIRTISLSLLECMEMISIRYAEKIVVSDINRARYIKELRKLDTQPMVVMNAPRIQRNRPESVLYNVIKNAGVRMDSDTKVVLFQGSINASYSILEIVQSMSLWPCGSILVLLGSVDAAFQSEINNVAASSHQQDRLAFIPYVPYSELLKYTAGAYIGLALIKPINMNRAFNAGASNKIFEYLSLGIPALVTDSLYFRDVLDAKAVYFVNTTSAETIGKAIREALAASPEEYRSKSIAARNEHMSIFNYETQFKPLHDHLTKTTHAFT